MMNDKEVLITVFTPTYNRAELLSHLYNSLLAQRQQNFEWVLVDDGSTDDTDSVVKSFIVQDRIPITYHKKSNEGKHLAINKGTELARGKVFFIVDSDDYLVETATRIISEYYSQIKDKDEIAGIGFRRGTSPDQFIGTQGAFENEILNVFDFRYRKNISGDMAEVYKTEVLRQFPFPSVAGEKFCAEGLVWNRIGLKYKMLWVSKIIYICHYMQGGLTDNSIKNRISSPTYATTYYSEFASAPVSITQRLKATANYWRFAHHQKITFKQKLANVSIVNSMIALPLILLLILRDKKR